MQTNIEVGGVWTFEGFESREAMDRGDSPLWVEHIHNGGTTVGLNDLLNEYFGGTSQSTVWSIGLVDNSGFTAFASSDTMASHVTWAESTAYGEPTRQQWIPGAAAGGIITNTSQAAFTMNASVTIKGGFLVNNSTKGGTTGILWATGAFNNAQTLTNGQVLRVSYTCTATSS